MNDSTTVPTSSKNQPSDADAQDVVQFVHSLLQQMQDRFQTMSDQILNRIDDMGSRIDDLEKNLDDLITNAGLPNPSNTAAISAEDGGSQNEPRQGE